MAVRNGTGVGTEVRVESLLDNESASNAVLDGRVYNPVVVVACVQKCAIKSRFGLVNMRSFSLAASEVHFVQSARLFANVIQ